MMRWRSLLVAVLFFSCTDGSLRSPSEPSAKDIQSDARQSGRRRAVRTPSSRPALLGAWGGEHIALELRSGGGSVELDCAHGSLDEAIVVAADGTFAVRGTLTLERGGPVTETDVENTRPARYRGEVSDGKMTLTLDGGDFTETYTLVKDRPAQIVKCL